MSRTLAVWFLFIGIALGRQARTETLDAVAFGADDSAMLKRALSELAIGLRDLHGIELKDDAESPAVRIIIGDDGWEGTGDLLSKVFVDSTVEEAYCLHFGHLDGTRVIAIRGNSERGLNYGILKANALLYEYWARTRDWPPEMTLQLAPRVPLRGLYTHLLYAHAYPYAPRHWKPEEHHLWFETLTSFGYNVHMLTPGIGVMETPLTEYGKQGLDYFIAQRDRARELLGMRFWPGDAANEVVYQEQPVPLIQRGLGGAEWVDPGDPEKLKDILDNREELFKHWPDLAAFWVIDGDPGGYPGSSAEEFVNLLVGLRERMDRARPEGKDAALVYWQWTTWSPELDENTGIPVLRMLKERMHGPWYVMVSNQSSLRNAREAGVLDRAIYFPYHLVEFEPHGPFTSPRLEDIRDEVNRGVDGGALWGSFCNAMSPLVQLPNIYYYQECLWHPKTQIPEGAAAMMSLAAQVIPDHADILAGAWLALETDPDSPLVPMAREKLEGLLKSDDLGIIGPVGRRWIPNARYHLECLTQMLAVNEKAGPARNALREHGFNSKITEDALTEYIRAYLEWIQEPGFYHPRRLLTGKGYNWINYEVIQQVRNRPNGEADARRMLRKVEERCKDVFAPGAAVAVRQISRGVVHFNDAVKEEPPELETGDIIVIDVGGELAEVVRAMTHSTYSHCGIVKVTDDGPMVIEGVDPARIIPFDEYMGQANGGYYVQLRVNDVPPERMEAVIAEAESFVGKPYDYQFEWDDAKIYCSELIYKAYQRGAGIMVGSRHKIGDLDWKPYEEYIRKQAGGELPLDRSLITPAELVRSPYTTILYNNFPR
jgi:hypothetical protein